MNGPSPKFLTDIAMGIDPSWGVPQPPAGPPLPPLAPALPPPATLESAIAQANAGAPLPPPPPPQQAPAPSPAAAPEGAPGPQGPQGPPATPVGYAPDGASPMSDDVQFRPVGGGGVSPAREARTRGPQQDAHLMSAFDAPAEAAGRIDMRTQLQAEREELAYEEQAKAAISRQEAADRVLVRRQNEQAQLMADYQDQVAKLGQMHLDDNRWWARKSTGDKIGTAILTFLGGIAALDPRGGGKNLVYDRVVQEIDNDLAAQKFDNEMGLEQAKGAQNAFGMMLQRYGTEDAAMAAARAGALDYAAAKANQIHAQWGGTDSANARDQLLGQLGAERERTIAAGFKFIPSQATAPRYQMAFRGQVAPGTFSEKDAQAKFLEHGIKPAERVDEKLVDGGVQASVAQAKAQAEHAGKTQDNTVVLPSGETVTAPGATEAKELRELAAQDHKIRTLVKRAKELRDEGFRVNPGNKGELESIQQQLRTAFSVSANLGALSNEDIKIADGAVGKLSDVYSLSSAPDRAVESYASMVRNNVSDRVKTYSGGAAAAPKATGKMPGSFTAHGSKK